MGRMIPDQFPPDTVSVAERRLFTSLKEGLDREYSVIHSLPWLKDRHRYIEEGECDFLILHPERGMLALETKTGEVRYDGPSKKWFDGNNKPIKDPFLQAQDSAHTLNDLVYGKMEEWRHVRPPFGHGVAFPDASKFLGNFPPHVLPEILILGSDLDRIQSRIENIMGHWGSPSRRLPADSFEEACKLLLEPFRVVVPLQAQLEEQTQGLVRLTRQQEAILKSLRHNPRLVIEGCAGSGKTILAMEHTFRLAADGARVLFTCFNIPLAEKIREKAAKRGADIDVHHFHGLCEEIVRKTGGSFQVERGSQEFWDYTLPEMLDEVITAFDKRYDAILVDEGQDFCPEWWIPLENLLADPDSGFFYVFTDPYQNIYERESELPFSQPLVKLEINCRNTSNIGEFLHRIGGVSSLPDENSVEGTPPHTQLVQDDQEEWDEIRKKLHDLLNIQKLQSKQVVILGHRRFKNSIFASRPKLGSFTLIDSEEPGKSNEVRYCTLHRFKGLEADCVIVTGVDGGPRHVSEEARRTMLYVAASRAKLLLYVFYRPASNFERWQEE